MNSNPVVIKDRRRKSLLTRLAELCSILMTLGVLGIMIQIGEYKANFRTLCEKVETLTHVMDANAAENRQDHTAIRAEISTTKQAVSAISGKPVQ